MVNTITVCIIGFCIAVFCFILGYALVKFAETIDNDTICLIIGLIGSLLTILGLVIAVGFLIAIPAIIIINIILLF